MERGGRARVCVRAGRRAGGPAGQRACKHAAVQRCACLSVPQEKWPRGHRNMIPPTQKKFALEVKEQRDAPVFF